MLDINKKSLVFEVRKIKREEIKLQNKNDLDINDPIKIRYQWTKTEDEAVLSLVDTIGIKRWTLVAKKLNEIYMINHRSGKQIRERWHNHLDRNIKKNYWSEKEKEVFNIKHSKFGNKWSEISKYLPGRTDNCVKNHFYSELRKLIRKILKQLNRDGFFGVNKLDRNLYSPDMLYQLMKKQTFTLDSIDKKSIINLILKNELISNRKIVNEKLKDNFSFLKRKKIKANRNKRKNEENLRMEGVKPEIELMDNNLEKKTIRQICNQKENNSNILPNTNNLYNQNGIIRMNELINNYMHLNEFKNKLIYFNKINDNNLILNSICMFDPNQMNLANEICDFQAIKTFNPLINNNMIPQINLNYQNNLNNFTLANNTFRGDIEKQKSLIPNTVTDNNFVSEIIPNNLMNNPSLNKNNLDKFNTPENGLNNYTFDLNKNFSFSLDNNYRIFNLENNLNNTNVQSKSFFSNNSNYFNCIDDIIQGQEDVNSSIISNNYNQYKNGYFPFANINTNIPSTAEINNFDNFKNFCENKLQINKINNNLFGSVNDLIVPNSSPSYKNNSPLKSSHLIFSLSPMCHFNKTSSINHTQSSLLNSIYYNRKNDSNNA